MHKKFLIPMTAGLALCAGAALAADPPAPPPGGPTGQQMSQPMGQQTGRPMGRHWRMNPQDRAQRFKTMCTNRYAHMVGGMASLQVRLKLTDQQKPAFEQWKDTVLSSAKKASDQCAAMKPPTQRPSLVDQAKFEERMLEMRLDGLKAQMPALEKLTAALDQNQDRILERAVHRMMERGYSRHGRHGGWHGHMRGRGTGGPGGSMNR